MKREKKKAIRIIFTSVFAVKWTWMLEGTETLLTLTEVHRASTSFSAARCNKLWSPRSVILVQRKSRCVICTGSKKTPPSAVDSHPSSLSILSLERPARDLSVSEKFSWKQQANKRKKKKKKPRRLFNSRSSRVEETTQVEIGKFRHGSEEMQTFDFQTILEIEKAEVGTTKGLKALLERKRKRKKRKDFKNQERRMRKRGMRRARKSETNHCP